MLIEFSSMINDINNSIYSVPLFNKILSNVLYTAIVLSIIILIVLIVIYPCKGDTSGWILTRLFIYISIINTFLLSVFRNTTISKCKEKYSDSMSNDFITNINSKTGGYIYHKDNMKVVPNLKKPEIEDDDDDSDDSDNSDSDDKPKENKNITISDMLDNIETQV